MASGLTGIFNELGRILGLCPLCNELFYVSESRPYSAGKRPRSIVDSIRAEEDRLDRADEALRGAEKQLRELAAKAGLKTAKRVLRRIAPSFTAAGYDHQDVKLIVSPITYVVFDGLAKSKLSDIVLFTTPPRDTFAERIQKSIRGAIQKGNLEFKTLRVDTDRGHISAE